ncbi:hypothetical protein MHK_005681 [Candidatus Magnetomorum sp. HK-1]|nr:hypothetical protein MHK_005681 [Candidatus Magnetomorum sp. HK-1]
MENPEIPFHPGKILNDKFLTPQSLTIHRDINRDVRAERVLL